MAEKSNLSKLYCNSVAENMEVAGKPNLFEKIEWEVERSYTAIAKHSHRMMCFSMA